MRYGTIMLVTLLGGGCTTYKIVALEPIDKGQASYAVLRINGLGKKVLYDCQSRPDGKNWTPICQPVTFSTSIVPVAK